MPFAIRNLAGLAYAANVTLWRFRTASDSRAALLLPDYFGPAGHLLRAGDMIMATAADGPLLLAVQTAEAGRATVAARGVVAAPPPPPPPPAGSLGALIAGQSLLAATLTAGSTGSPAPSAPTLAGLTLRSDIDYGAPASGSFPTAVISRAGTDGSAQAVIGGGAPSIVTMANGRRAADLNGTSDWISLQNYLAVLGTADAPFTFAAVLWRKTAGVTQGALEFHRGAASNAATIHRHSLLWTAANAQTFRRCDGASNADVSAPGAPSTTSPIIYVYRSNRADSSTRGMANGGAKVSTAAKAMTSTTAWVAAVGARFVNNTPQDFAAMRIERQWLYEGAASDTDLDAIHAALAAYYV